MGKDGGCAGCKGAIIERVSRKEKGSYVNTCRVLNRVCVHV